ncbi:hypothetical protein Ddye_019475 [Dipteronia dyeriana]|uniref:Terpene synthase metal-binding domain-containing protein n=1 Tax=Dipteronia dyeriana TaxID=168575 RepID=A0AAD9WW40_9ROSI|nr:hypothetical protein Ddye_019475 [Dipteronia dyeriana]
MEFDRDRLVIAFLWTLGTAFKPRFGSWRILNTKIIPLIIVIDDIYDVYGTLEKLELFTDVVDRWDIQAMKELPKYMKLCFPTLFNFTNELAYVILKEQGLDVFKLKSSYELKLGDILISIQCSMNETGASEEVAHQHTKDLMRQPWKKVNAYRAADTILSETSIELILNLVRMAHCVYLYGDGHDVQEETKNFALPLGFEPIPL